MLVVVVAGVILVVVEVKVIVEVVEVVAILPARPTTLEEKVDI